MKNQGKLLVIEGTDGSGKTTQINLLSQYLKTKGIDFEVVSFPQYGKNEYAEFIYDYLSGKFGGITSVEVHELAKKYAEDRKTIRDQIKNWLSSGKLVIANRYVSSSKAHLGATVPEDKRADFINWIDDLEYQENQMPREDLTVLLDVDVRVGQKNSQEKNHPDLHEDSLTHQTSARDIFLQLVKSNPNWYVVDCMSGASMRSPKEIQRQVVRVLNQKLNSLTANYLSSS